MPNIKCGHCQQYHGSVAEVKACAGGFAAEWKPPTTGANGATPKQVAFLERLLAERDHGFDESTMELQRRVTTQSKRDTSRLIDQLMACPKKDAPTTLEDGIYRAADGTLYRVYHTVHGANQQVASIINVDVDREARKADKFTYAGKAPLATLTPAMRLTFEEAVQFGSAYGWCVRCGSVLHNDRSVELGIGPVCRGYFA